MFGGEWKTSRRKKKITRGRRKRRRRTMSEEAREIQISPLFAACSQERRRTSKQQARLGGWVGIYVHTRPTQNQTKTKNKNKNKKRNPSHPFYKKIRKKKERKEWSCRSCGLILLLLFWCVCEVLLGSPLAQSTKTKTKNQKMKETQKISANLHKK